jgi:two-component sensor histidine kinase
MVDTGKTAMAILHFPTNAKPIPPHEGIALNREADHRIANNLSLVVGLLRMRARAVSQGEGTMDRAEVRGLLDDVAARVETVAQLHRMLSQSYRNALVDLGSYLRELATSLTGALSPDARVHVSHHAEDKCVLPPDQVLTLGLLVSEVVTNSVKYAHPSGVPVKIDIHCEQNAVKLTVEIADDGVGLPEDFDPMTGGGLGFRMVRALTAQLGATVRFDSNELGTRVLVEIPTPASR